MRNVVYEDGFDRQLKEIEPDFERADEFIRGVEWALARNPETGKRLDSQYNIWHIPLIDIFPKPLAAYYTFDDERVYMLSIQVPSDYLDS